jgi:hypothetical protein
MFCVSVTLGDTVEEARQRRERFAASLPHNMSFLTGIDFSKFPLDEPLPEIESKTNASRASFAA